MAIKVMALRVVANMLMPAAHQGIRPPALKIALFFHEEKTQHQHSSKIESQYKVVKPSEHWFY